MSLSSLFFFRNPAAHRPGIAALVCLTLAACGGGTTDGGGTAGGPSSLADRYDGLNSRVTAMRGNDIAPPSGRYAYDGVARFTVASDPTPPTGLNNSVLRNSFTVLADVDLEANFTGGGPASSRLEGRGNRFAIQGQPQLSADGALIINAMPLNRGPENSLEAHGPWRSQIDIYPTSNPARTDRLRVDVGDFDAAFRGPQGQGIQGLLNGQAALNDDPVRRTVTGGLRAERR